LQEHQTVATPINTNATKSIMAILLTNSNTFQKMVAIGLTSCNAERKKCNAPFLWQHSPPIATFLDKCCKTHPYYNIICGDANGIKWQ
jgi:hypothetical protein